MTVCLTGDVHHMSLDTRDQAYMDGTEVEAALTYARIAAEHDVPVTLFVTGKAAEEEPERVRELAATEGVEIGGHDYWCFDTPVHDAWRALGKVTGGALGSWNGPRSFQAWEIRKTMRAFADLGVEIRSWRDHAYRHDANTPGLLREAGITHLSDAVEPGGRVREADGLTRVPINAPPDHEHVYHAFRTPEFVAEHGFEGPFGTESVDVAEWTEWVRAEVASVTDDGGVATALAHPACMALADGFEAFEALCEALARGYDTETMADVSG